MAAKVSPGGLFTPLIWQVKLSDIRQSKTVKSVYVSKNQIFLGIVINPLVSEIVWLKILKFAWF